LRSVTDPARPGPGIEERFVTFACEGETCVGVLTMPKDAPVRSIGVVIVVGGPQYRVGSHRQFVHLARALARAGIPALRFDVRGMGDSAGARRDFDSVGEDIGAALRAMAGQCPGVRIVLWGLCDGASAALMYAAHDPAVVGVVAANPWARSERSRDKAQLKYYYRGRLRSRQFWAKLVTGRFDLVGSAKGLFATVLRTAGLRAGAREPSVGETRRTDYLARMDAAWRELRRPVLFVVSGRDIVAREFSEWVTADPARTRLYESEGAQVYEIREADHTFSTREWRDAVAGRTIEWVRGLEA
jgi:exosortase A-associated hydrolase 1